MPLNFVIPDWQLTIGDWDITHIITDFNLRRPRAEISTPYSWQGSFTVGIPKNPSLLTESLDDLENPYRWAIGMHAIALRIKGTLVATVRIKRYSYDEDSRTGQAELCDQLGLRDFESPPKDFEGLGFQVSRGGTSTSSVANRLLNLTGVASVVNIPGNFEVPPNKFNESYISLAQQICGERGYWLYCDENEVVRSVAYSKRDLLFMRSRKQVKDFERQSGLEIPAEIVRVAGGCEKIAVCGGEAPQITEEFAYVGDAKILQRRETMYPPVTQGNQVSRRFVIEQALGAAFPKQNPGSSAVIKVEDTTETSYFDSKGRLTKSEIKTDRRLGLALSDNFPGNKVMVDNAEIVTVEYKNTLPGTVRLGGYDDGVLRSKITTKKVLFPVGSGSYQLATKEQIVETWDENSLGNAVAMRLAPIPEDSPKCERYEYKRLTYQRNSVENVDTVVGSDGEVESQSTYYSLGELLLKNTDRQPNQTPPAWTTKEPDFPVGSVTIKGETRFAPATFSSYYEKEFESSCSTLTYNAEAETLARLIGNLQHQRYRSRLVTMPIPQEWLDDPTPFGYVHIHNGAFLMDSQAIALEQDSLVFSFIANYLGSIPAIGDIPPVTPSTPVSPINQISIISNNYDYLINLNIDDVFTNSGTAEITASYDYGIFINPHAVISSYDCSITINSTNLTLYVFADYNHEIFMDIGYSANLYNYDILINYPSEITTYITTTY